MTKKQRALEIIDRLKKEYPDADWIMIRHGNFWSVSVWQRSVRMPE